MVAHITCTVCLTQWELCSPEITFHHFPIKNESQMNSWRSILTANTKIDFDPKEAFICSRHFTSDDFSFIDGKLVLRDSAVPSLFPPKRSNSSQQISDERPPIHGSNFASTATVNYVTVSSNYPRATSSCTESTRIIAPSIYEISALKGINEISKSSNLATEKLQKSNKNLRLKLKRLHLLLKRMKKDEILTGNYVDGLEQDVSFILHSMKHL